MAKQQEEAIGIRTGPTGNGVASAAEAAAPRPAVIHGTTVPLMPPMPRWLVALLGLVSLLSWVVLFAIGILIDSSPFRTALGPPQPQLTLGNLVGASLLYTPINIALLTICAGLLGGCTSLLSIDARDVQDRLRRAHESGRQDLINRFEKRLKYLTESPLVSMFRGFLVYLGIVSGILLAISDPFETPSPGEYIRLAGLFSVIAFVMGYDPTRFEDLLDRITSWQRGAGDKPEA
jgi:hypothetical protein